jgi:hypothetical protein
MNENRRRILDMLATGKITADEAERLLSALDKEQPSSSGLGNAEAPRAKAKPKYMRVQVEAEDQKDGPVKVNVRIPMQLLHAGVKFTSLIPPQAREHLNRAFRGKGMDFDINSLNPENLDDIIEQLNDLTVDVDHKDAKVRVFCE